MPYLLFLKKQQNLKLLTAAIVGGALWVNKKLDLLESRSSQSISSAKISEYVLLSVKLEVRLWYGLFYIVCYYLFTFLHRKLELA